MITHTQRLILVVAATVGAFLGDARTATAHCTSPEVIRPFFRNSAPDEVQLFMSFGKALSIDQGATWKLQCEEIYQSAGEPIGPNNVLLSPAGKLVLGHFTGLLTSDDKGCHYLRAAGVPKDQFGDPMAAIDVALDPGNPETKIWANIDDTLFLSSDGGKCVKPSKRFCGQTLLRLAVSPVDPKVLYVLAFATDAPGFRFIINSTLDGGVTWETHSSPFLADEVRLAHVSPSDPRTLYLVRGIENEELYVSSDRGKTARSLFDSRSTGASGFDARIHLARGPAATELWVGVPGADDNPTAGRLHRSMDSGATWVPVAGTHPHFRCLTQFAGKLWACGNNKAAAGDTFALGVSTDGGATWTKKLAFGELCHSIASSVCDAIFASTCVPGVCDGVPGNPAAGPTCATTGLADSAEPCAYTLPTCEGATPGADASVDTGIEPQRDADAADGPVEPGEYDSGCCSVAATPVRPAVLLLATLILGVFVASRRRR